jgi:DNA processing protein
MQGVTPRRFGELLAEHDTVEAIATLPAAVLHLRRRSAPRPDHVAAAASEIQEARKVGARILGPQDEDYPPLLREIPDPPICLYVMGNLKPARHGALALVGARSASRYGLEQALCFGIATARCGVSVVSGLAMGIDCRAHEAALQAEGHTVAVLGSGMAGLSTHRNRKLAEDILSSGGAVITEMRFREPASKSSFPIRNRIIAGMCVGTVVIEAAQRSGALITARLATEYNREVFAVPGDVRADSYAGNHALIQRGTAKLITNIEDILTDLGHARSHIRREFENRSTRLMEQHRGTLSAEEQRVFDALSASDTDLDTLWRETKLPPELISSALITLQLKQLVEQMPGNRFARLT